ncbi:MAG TPA: cytochrome C oxidase subunit II [Burkholderiales bacterium]|nr:cytochrome C oxidase subunit II [Burkholderiales bacterium]
MSAAGFGPEGAHASEAVAVAAERRWAVIVGIIIALLVLMMIFTGIHWASMPPSRVETIDPRTLHVSGEFVESNLGTSVAADGKVMVRLVAQQYSFEPQCILVPANTPVTFRGTSSDVVHGFVVGTTNANVMLIPGFVATFTTTFRKTGEQLMPCHEYCGTGHAAMWAHFQVIPAQDFAARARKGERLTCVSR